MPDTFDPAAPRASGDGLLVVEDVRQTYDGRVALDGVTLDVAPGEIVSLLGASGCGKTTLLRLVAGVERPGAGRIFIDGREVAGPQAFVAPEERGVGLVFQDYALFPHMTVLENVMFGLRRTPRGKAREAALRGLDHVALARYADKYPQALSGGEQQRVALARALAPRPRVLLMDEPFSNLDQRLREQVRDETMKILRAEGVSVVLVTHDPEEAMHVTDRIALMRKGAIVQTGTAEDLYARPRSLFAARFFCDLNEIAAEAKEGRASTPLGVFAAPGVPDGPCLVCLRPQAFMLDPPDGSGVEATMIARRFLGRVDRLTLEVAGFGQALHARLRDTRSFEPGQRVRLGVDERDALVFGPVQLDNSL